jgi:hypothetical protein
VRSGIGPRAQLPAEAGAWTEEGYAGRPYLAVATDGRVWEVFSPRLLEAQGGIEAENVLLEPSERWEPPDDEPGASLRDFLNRLFFRKTLLAPSIANVVRDFGESSPAYLASKHELMSKLGELAADTELRVLRRQWTSALQVAYGSVETDDELFAKHTYLAMLARLLAWAAFEHRHLEVGELDDVVSGLYFRERNVANFVENDYFRWHQIPSSTDAANTWRALTRHLAGYDLSAIREDILKPLYEQLVDPATRHELGEYYTPDWLATLLTQRLLREWDWTLGTPAVLDPTCGSGTFLRTVLEEVRNAQKTNGKALLYDLTSRVMGIDVHPLAVIVSRATYLLAIQDLIQHADGPVTLPVFLASSLDTPKLSTTASLWGERTDLRVEERRYPVPVEFVHSQRVFDDTIDAVVSVAAGYGHSGNLEDVSKSLNNKLEGRLTQFHDRDELVEVLGSMAAHIATLIRTREDSVYGFMLKNHYRPTLLRGLFDFVIGNPPWLTVGDIGTADYKARVVELAVETNIAPRAAGEQAHTELATIFLSQVLTEFLAPRDDIQGPRVGLVMPRSVFTATHHKLLREGKYKPQFDVVELWDLFLVSPLFNVPACVLLAMPSAAKRADQRKPGLLVSGRPPVKDASWHAAEPHLTLVDVEFELAFLGKRSAWRVATDSEGASLVESVAAGRNDYLNTFEQGAVLYPQTLLVVVPQGSTQRVAGSVVVKGDKEAAKTAKKLTSVRLNQLVDSSNLYCTAAADHILPYTAKKLWVVVLPTLTDPSKTGFRAAGPDELRLAGRVDTANWLEWANKKWERARKKSETANLWERLDHLGHLSAQAGMGRWVVVYTASGKRPVACVIDASSLDFPFVARDKTYWTSFKTVAEANYMCCFLNSDHVAAAIKDWMTLGLFGQRDIHKRVLDVPWPKFDAGNAEHAELATVGAKCRRDAITASSSLPAQSLGRQRKWMRAQLSQNALQRVEELVSSISASVPRARSVKAPGVFTPTSSPRT